MKEAFIDHVTEPYIIGTFNNGAEIVILYKGTAYMLHLIACVAVAYFLG